MVATWILSRRRTTVGAQVVLHDAGSGAGGAAGTQHVAAPGAGVAELGGDAVRGAWPGRRLLAGHPGNGRHPEQVRTRFSHVLTSRQ